MLLEGKGYFIVWTKKCTQLNCSSNPKNIITYFENVCCVYSYFVYVYLLYN